MVGRQGWKECSRLLPDLQGLLERFCKLEATFSILQANGSDSSKTSQRDQILPSDPLFINSALV